MKNIFRYSKKDSFLILYTVMMLSLPILLAFFTPSIPWLMLITFFHIWFLVNGQNSAEHHHTHWPTFWNEKLNRIYEIFLTMTYGIPVSHWRDSHFLHHKHVNDKPVNGITQDPISVYAIDPEKGELNNFWVYCLKGTWKFNIKGVLTWHYVPHPRENVPEIYKQCRREIWAFRLFLIAIFAINSFYGLWLLGTYLLAYVVNQANSYGEHWGVLSRRGDTTQDSIGIYSKWYNFIGFNAGHHQEHHHRPGVHWTKLPLVTPLLHPNRMIKKHGIHITNNPFWSHFVLLLKGEKAIPK